MSVNFMIGFIAGIVATFFVAEIADSVASSTCKRQDWTGEACQCRLIMEYDKKEPKP